MLAHLATGNLVSPKNFIGCACSFVADPDILGPPSILFQLNRCNLRASNQTVFSMLVPHPSTPFVTRSSNIPRRDMCPHPQEPRLGLLNVDASHHTKQAVRRVKQGASSSTVLRSLNSQQLYIHNSYLNGVSYNVEYQSPSLGSERGGGMRRSAGLSHGGCLRPHVKRDIWQRNSDDRNGDRVPHPGSLDHEGAATISVSTPRALSHIPRLFSTTISHLRLRQEVKNNRLVSQWWGHCGLHQDEVWKATSLPINMSYARHCCVNALPIQDPEVHNPSALMTLMIVSLGKLLPYQRPDPQPPPYKSGNCQCNSFSIPSMSSTTPTGGDDIHRNKTRNTNNSTSHELITPLTDKKKGKGVSMAEEPDPEAITPANDSPMPSSGPVLMGPHSLDKTNPGEISSYPAASQSVKHIPAANRSASSLPPASKSSNAPSAQTAASRSTSNTNKASRKPSTSGMNQPAASLQQTPAEPSESALAFREDLINLQAAIHKEVVEDDTQSSSLSHTEGRRVQYTASTKCKESETQTIFWDIDAAQNIPIWAESIIKSTECMFGKFTSV
ncbi:uncharacterized protein LACBIDRAFT_330822 [Laccaria bicolor S238N-H82]|uniref:Predicted protein n=1 Tax=Laccaria bicolor (strain S238N-H82 / ATCC MYA-4686) TaxID=486041 RepID=B0DML0_LACBS|nr:uncharacterized protein LACBIDRAFT_330822 [Laccaria bicolor S238N-H82]EDR04306.1 predicted protein [Laccaria bicolor S238N-H82]|eukprot:XP_001885197.1 predicted protein [Laccaria bicolor S238N-H82]